jgi:hypothetical protein
MQLGRRLGRQQIDLSAVTTPASTRLPARATTPVPPEAGCLA